MKKYVEKTLDELLFFPSTNSGLTQKYIYQHKGNIPVYSSRKDGKPVGYVKDNLNNVKYYENCLSYNRNGSVGNAFYRDHKFCPTEDHRPIIIKEEFKNSLDYKYLSFKIEETIFNNGYNWNDKAGKEKVQRLSIEIPINIIGEFDILEQKKIFNQHSKVREMKNNFLEFRKRLQYFDFSISDNYETKMIDITEIFTPYKGNSKYTIKYINNNIGDFPVYSSKTFDEGILGYINSYDWDVKEAISWTTDGVYAGTCFFRTGKFNLSGHAGLLVPNDRYYKYNLNLEYISCILKKILLDNAEGIDGQNKRVTIGIIKNVQIPIPVDKHGKFDLSTQIKIAKKYSLIIKEKNNIMQQLDKLINSDIIYQ